MRFLPSRLFGRLVLGLVAVSVLAVGVGASYIYARFHNSRSMFYEGTVQGFAALLMKDVRFENGATRVNIAQSTIDQIAESGGQFIIVDGNKRRLAGSSDVSNAFIWYDDTASHYFWLSRPAPNPDLFGLSATVPGALDGAVLQIAVPEGHILFESVLHEFMKDIAWLWLPFLLMILITNVLVARLALRPLSAVVEQAGAIQPGGVEVTLSEKGLPSDVLALVRTVNEAIGRLRQAYRIQEEFVADMAHELRTPIAVLKAQVTSSHDDQAREILRDLDMMERLVEQLLDRARLGKFRIETGSVVDLGDVARDVAAFLAPRVVERQRRIEVRAEHKVLVQGGYDDIFRALRNLVENALQYSPLRGLISIEVTKTPSILVTDSGPGYPMAVLDGERQTRRMLRSDRRDGAGLGLSIVERTMEAHGGALHLINPPNGGACAEMIFPNQGQFRDQSRSEQRALPYPSGDGRLAELG